MASSLIEHLLSGECNGPKGWNERTKDTLADILLEVIADRKQVTGPRAKDLPRLVMLTRAFERNAEFRFSLLKVSETILELFPNDPSLDQKTETE